MSLKRRWLLWLAAPVGMLGLLFMPWRMCVVVGSSMEPFLHTGDVLVLNRFVKDQISRGTLVVFKYNGKTTIKKVHALPGDRVTEAYYTDIGQANVVAPEDEWRWRRLGNCDVQARLIHFRIPEGYLYVLGTGSTTIDSRDFGLVPISSVMGVVKFGPRRQARPMEVGPETVSVPPRIQDKPLYLPACSLQAHNRT